VGWDRGKKWRAGDWSYLLSITVRFLFLLCIKFKFKFGHNHVTLHSQLMSLFCSNDVISFTCNVAHVVFYYNA